MSFLPGKRLYCGPVSVAKTKQRYGGVVWGNASTAVLMDSWYDTRNQKTYLINPSAPGTQPQLVFDRNYQDIYSDPGSFETKENEYGRNVLAIEGDNLFLIGKGFTKEGQFPFIDEFNLKTLKTKRLYQSAAKDKMETIYSIEDFKTGWLWYRCSLLTSIPIIISAITKRR
ncbi:hypothetical protein KRR40_18550 [Niabella defluvii]|nr:hypothetical protein KRR40_18550 [Niabella sp. I65]